MGKSRDVWLFALANVLTFVLALVLTGVAYKVYKREGADLLLATTSGFALLTLRTLTEALYEFGINKDSRRSNRNCISSGLPMR